MGGAVLGRPGSAALLRAAGAHGEAEEGRPREGDSAQSSQGNGETLQSSGLLLLSRSFLDSLSYTQ